jgi:hypothetical protein
MAASIPPSTKAYWKNFDKGRILGLDNDLLSEDKLHIIRSFLQSKKLFAAAKALFLVYSAYQKILLSLPDHKSILRKHKELIIDTVQKIAPVIGKARTLKCFNISLKTFISWSFPCSSSPFRLCRRSHPAQLSASEIKKMTAFISEERFRFWSLKSIYYQALKEAVVFMGLSTWYRYCNALSLKKPVFKKLKNKMGLRSSVPGQILHTDVSLYRTADNTRVYIYLVIDNFSRAILSWKASLSLSAVQCLDTCKDALKKVTGVPEFILSDDGTENGKLKEALEHKIAQKDITFSNSMVEAVFKHLKYFYLYPITPANFTEFLRSLERAIEDYNHKPHGALFGLTPLECFEGELVDRKRYAAEITNAAKERLLINKLGCGAC